MWALSHLFLVTAAFTQTRVRVRVSVYSLWKLHSYEWSVYSHLYKHITQRVSAILDNIESKKCFAIKTTIFHYKVAFFYKLHISYDQQFYDDVSSDKYVPRFL